MRRATCVSCVRAARVTPSSPFTWAPPHRCNCVMVVRLVWCGCRGPGTPVPLVSPPHYGWGAIPYGLWLLVIIPSHQHKAAKIGHPSTVKSGSSVVADRNTRQYGGGVEQIAAPPGSRARRGIRDFPPRPLHVPKPSPKTRPNHRTILALPSSHTKVWGGGGGVLGRWNKGGHYVLGCPKSAKPRGHHAGVRD